MTLLAPTPARRDITITTCLWIAHREGHQRAIRFAASTYAAALMVAAYKLGCAEDRVCLRYRKGVTARRSVVERMARETI